MTRRPMGRSTAQGRCYRRSVDPEIRPIRDDEVPAFIDAVSTGFLMRPDIDRVAETARRRWDLERTIGAFDDGRICATFRSWPTEVTVPGGARLPASAIAAVTVRPTHRRRGILRRLMAAEHAAMPGRGEAVGLLYASEYPIYGRFGYGPACRTATWTVTTQGVAVAGDPHGRVELVAPDQALGRTLRDVFDAWRVGQTGEIRRREVAWDEAIGLVENGWDPAWRGFVALHRDGSGAVDGYARYRAEWKWDARRPASEIQLDELHALTDAAYAGLWRFLLEVDLVARVTASQRRPSEPLPWLLSDARAAAVSEIGDGLWLRLIDLPRALQARTYATAIDLVLETLDDEAPNGRHRLRLRGGVDRAECQPTDRPVDLTVDVGALGAAYLGGVRLRDAARRTGLVEHRPGAAAELEAALRMPDEPWCSTFF